MEEKVNVKLGIAGAKGSFSEEAALYYCRNFDIEKYSLEYLVSVKRVLEMLEQGKIDLGVFPIENSNGGVVYESVKAISKHLFSIEKFFEIDVRHNFLVLPGKKKEDIKKVASHLQAIKQCRMYLKRKWPNIEIIEWSDTAEAARDLKEGKLEENTAVIAPKRSAEIYGLEIFEESIQDLKFNFTTFLAVRK